MIEYRCPKCRARLSGDPSTEGRLDRCPRCGHAFIVPVRRNYLRLIFFGIAVAAVELGAVVAVGLLWPKKKPPPGGADAVSIRQEPDVISGRLVSLPAGLVLVLEDASSAYRLRFSKSLAGKAPLKLYLGSQGSYRVTGVANVEATEELRLPRDQSNASAGWVTLRVKELRVLKFECVSHK